jgi:hypothetical protein
MSVGFRDPQPPSPPSRIRLRVLWRLQGPTKVVAAALYRHPARTELLIYFEPENAADVLETRFCRFDVRELEERAEAGKKGHRFSG